MSKRASTTAIGAFVVGALVLAVIAVAVLGSGRFFRDIYPFVCYFEGGVNGLNVGAPVKFKGVEIGSVTKILLRFEQEQGDVHIPVFIGVDEERISAAGATPDLEDPAWLKAAIGAGLRARLEPQSLVTGLLFVQLDYLPDTPITLVSEGRGIPEIPTLPTVLEEARSAVEQVLKRLDEINFKALVDSGTNAARAVEQLAASPEFKTSLTELQETLKSIRALSDGVRPELTLAVRSVNSTFESSRVTLGELDQTLQRTRSLVEPDSPLAFQLSEALEEITLAARSVRALASSLDRDPTMLLRGRATEGRAQ